MKKIKITKKTILRIVLIILIIIWAVFVFNLSNQQGNESSGLSKKITAIFFRENLVDQIEPYIRKLAHFSEYGLGGVLFISLFLTYKWSEAKQIIISIICGAWYAGIDEIHQLFIPDRNGSIKDVCIDTLGVATGVCTMMLLYKIVKMIIEKRKNNK